jgi:hypothetical protein
VVDFISEINQHKAPPCLASADKSLRAALNDFKNGTQKILDGIDDIDPSKIEAGNALITKGANEIRDATTKIEAATCSTHPIATAATLPGTLPRLRLPLSVSPSPFNGEGAGGGSTRELPLYDATWLW